jgi:sugar phosphate isomerase/epimerase
MSRAYSLSYLTAASLTPPQAVELAARLGYDYAGLRILPIAPGGGFAPLIDDVALLKETQARIRDGAGVYDVEVVRIGPDFRVESVRPFLEVCGALGARAVLMAADDPQEARMAESFAAFCDAAAPYGLTADLEFMPWTEAPSVKAATRIVARAGRPNGRVLVDALHFERSGSTLEDVAAIPKGFLGYAQICDGPAIYSRHVAAMIHTAREARLPPGEGDIDLKALFDALPHDLPVSVEIPHALRIKEAGVEAWARDMLAMSRRVLG